MLPAENLTLSVGKPRKNAETILKTCELFIYGDIYYIASLFGKHVLKWQHCSVGCELRILHIFRVISIGLVNVIYVRIHT
jgi:hypothetical protein